MKDTLIIYEGFFGFCILLELRMILFHTVDLHQTLS